MWLVLKYKSNSIDLLKQDLKKNLGKDCFFYRPKILVEKFYRNKLIRKNFYLLNDYIFCRHQKFTSDKTIKAIKFSRGLKTILGGHKFYQTEIEKFINSLKKIENERGYVTNKVFNLDLNKIYEMNSGPFTGKLFKIIEFNKNKLKIFLGNFTTLVNKNSISFFPK